MDVVSVKFKDIFIDSDDGRIIDEISRWEYESIPGLDLEKVNEYMRVLFKAINTSRFSGSALKAFREQLKALEKELKLELFEFRKNITPLPVVDPRVACIVYFNISNNWGTGGLPETLLPGFMTLLSEESEDF